MKMISQGSIMDQLYPYPEYKEIVATLDEKLEKIKTDRLLSREKITIANNKLLYEMKEQQQELDRICENILSDTPLSVNNSYSFDITNGEVKVTFYTEGTVTAVSNNKEHISKLRSLNASIKKIEDRISENDDKDPLLKKMQEAVYEIATYSSIIQISKGFKDLKICNEIWSTFPVGIYQMDDCIIKNELTFSNLLTHYRAKNFSDITSDAPFPLYLTINPSMAVVTEDNQTTYTTLLAFKNQIEYILTKEEKMQGKRDRFLGKSFLWDMQKRIEYFKEQHP